MKHLFTLKSLLLTLVMLCGLNAYAQTWEEVSIDALTSSDVFLIVDNYSGAALINSNGTGSAPTATSVMTKGSIDVSKIKDDMKWNISGNSKDGYTFYVNGDHAKWLYCTNINNGVRVGANGNKLFTIDGNYLKNSATGRYVGVYNNQDWRCYTSKGGNIANTVTAFFKYVEDPTAVAMPTIEATPTPVQDDKYYLNTDVTATIKCATKGATIQYAITGNDVTEATEIASWTNGSEVSFTSSEPATRVLWAKAVKEGNESPVASKEFTFIKEPVLLKYELVVDKSQIVPGAKYVITNSDDTRAMLGWVSDDNNCKESEITISNSVLELPSDFTGIITLGKDETGYTLKQLDGLYLTATGTKTSKTNYMKAVSAPEDNSHWTIEIGNDHVASIVNAKNTNAGIMQYNSSSKLFSCYNEASQNSLHLYRMATVATETGLDAVLVGTVNGMYQIKTPLRVNYKDEEYVYASTIGGGSTKTSPTDAQKKEWWSDDENKFKFTQNDWVAIQNSGLEVGAEIEAGSVATLVSNDAFPVVEFVSEVNPTTVSAIDANTYRVANFNIGSDSPLVNKLWLVEPQPAEYCKVKGYVDATTDVKTNYLFAKTGSEATVIEGTSYEPLKMTVNLADAATKITKSGWYVFEGIVIKNGTIRELNAISATVGSIETGVEGVETSSVKVYGAEGVINVESEEVAPIAVYSANGAIVSSVEASSASIAVAPGFYIVKAGNSVSKVTVK